MKVWSLFFVVLVAGFGFGVGDVEACSIGGKDVEGILCELTWEKQNMPECLELTRASARQHFETHQCNHEISVFNGCSYVDYEMRFHCSDGVTCPESQIILQRTTFTSDLGFDVFANASEEYEEEVVIEFVRVNKNEVESQSDDAGEEDEAIAVVFTATGESYWYVDYGEGPYKCDDDHFLDCGCGVAPVRPVSGGLGGVLVVLGMVLWRRWVVG